MYCSSPNAQWVRQKVQELTQVRTLMICSINCLIYLCVEFCAVEYTVGEDERSKCLSLFYWNPTEKHAMLQGLII